MLQCMYILVHIHKHTAMYMYVIVACLSVSCNYLACHPKYSILYGALMIFVVGSGQE